MAESYDKAWQLATLRESVAVWNLWRKEHPEVRIDLSQANLSAANLHDADLSRADLSGADLSGADLNKAYLFEVNLSRAQLHKSCLIGAGLRGANLRWAHLNGVDLSGADLSGARLSWAHLRGADLRWADLDGANLNAADLSQADLCQADLSGADLRWADLSRANLSRANLRGADLSGADLGEANFVRTNLSCATLSGCHIYGISCWDVGLSDATQQELCITPAGQPEITVDNLKVAQFIYLMLNNEEIRDVIDTITSKVVLILGRFTPMRKAVLDALRDELRKHNYLPVVFDFERPSDQSFTQTVTLLARMARFIVADLTMPSSIPQELDAIVPTVIVPVQPILELGHEPWAMYKDYWPYEWVLPVHRYNSQNELLASIQETVIAPAEAKVESLRSRRQQVYQLQEITTTPNNGTAEQS